MSKMTSVFLICVVILILKCSGTSCFFFIVPEDVAMGFTAYYGFAPRIFKGNDHRVGFGFRFGNHADLQILYEFGPQTSTKSLQEIRVRSAPQRQREVRRPVVDLLLRSGFLKRVSYRNSNLNKTAEIDNT